MVETALAPEATQPAPRRGPKEIANFLSVIGRSIDNLNRLGPVDERAFRRVIVAIITDLAEAGACTDILRVEGEFVLANGWGETINGLALHDAAWRLSRGEITDALHELDKALPAPLGGDWARRIAPLLRS